MTNHAVVHCNAGPEYGMGHLMRSLALVEEAQMRGWSITLGGDLSPEAVQIARILIPDLEPHMVSAEGVAEWLNRTVENLHPQVMHLDTYVLEQDEVPRGTCLVSNMQDGRFGRRGAEIVVDANLGAEENFEPEVQHLGELVGIGAALIRGQVRRERTLARSKHRRPRLLVVLGGTDPENITTRVVEALVTLATPVDLTVICGADQRAAVEEAVDGTPHKVTVVGFLSNLPATASAQDLIVSAAGTSVWDFACMGIPMALICVVENQLPGYSAVTGAGLALPLGVPPHANLISRIGLIDELLNDQEALTRSASQLREQVDGLGAWRLVSTWEQLLESRPKRLPSDTISQMGARPAKIGDARMLLEWRNDPDTRSVSRETAPVKWDDHLSWMERTMVTDDRQLLVICGYAGTSATEALGTVRWDRQSTGWEASITVAPGRRGQGLASEILRCGEAALKVSGPTRLLATIHVDNVPSQHLFTKAGYLPHLPANEAGFAVYARWVFDARQAS